MASSKGSSSTPSRIAIIGAGLGGLTISLFLHRLNIPITIFESRAQDASDGGFVALAPNAAHVLDQLGLYQDLLAHGFAYEEYTFLSSRNCSRIGSVLNGSRQRYGFPALRISRHVLRQTLLNAVLQAGIEVNFEHKLTDINETSKGVTLTFSTDTQTPNSPFTYLIACDGIHSRVRRLIFPSSPLPAYTGQLGIGGGQVPRSSLPLTLPLPCLILGPQNSFMMMPTTSSGEVVNVSATIEISERSRAEWADLANDKAALKQILVERHCGAASTWPAVVRESCEASESASLTTWPFYNAPVLDSWMSKSGRVILAGDAAHAMPPTGGQGAAMAFEDAASLSRCFTRVAADGDVDISADLLAWQLQRQQRIERVKAFTSKGGDARRATASTLQMVVKEWLMWAFFWWKGPDGGFAWIYEHREGGACEEVRLIGEGGQGGRKECLMRWIGSGAWFKGFSV